MKIGFIGLGNMGRAAARNILRAGFALTVHDINKSAADPLLAEGALWADTPASLLDQVDIVVSMVFGPPQIEQVVRGTNGLLATSCKGKGWIDMTTSSPMLMRELASEFESAGGLPVDSPVTGSVDSAIRGDMILFVGGTDAAIAFAKPVLEVVGVIRLVGRYGNGYVAKLVNNQLWFIHAAAIGEAMVAAKKAGLEPEVWWAAMKGGAAESFVMQHDVPSIFAGHYDPSFRLELCLKDLALIDELLKFMGTRQEITGATYARFREAAQRYGVGAGEMTVCKVIEDDAGVALRVAGDWTPPWEVKHPDEAQTA
ncbi:MAG: NAD(P)-dependent oxidoreductase [Rhodoferax sp.]|nr:NAD(P)-dependent oxidoreductase [Rhodoferax sp.]